MPWVIGLYETKSSLGKIKLQVADFAGLAFNLKKQNAFLCSMSDGKKYACCQSCGLPWDKDPQGGGTNADGSKSNMYCSYCYREGNFVNPNLTADEMQAYASKKLQQYGIPGFLANMLTKGIPDLERWKPTV